MSELTGYLKVGDQGFELDGKPYFPHLATYFGRRPGTCGADWLGEHFEHNMKFLPDDIKRWQELGMSGVFAFIPAGFCFDPQLKPIPGRLGQLDRFFDAMARGGMKVLVIDGKYIGGDAWCALKGISPGDAPWTPALHPEAERAKIEAAALFRSRFAERPEIIGWMTRSPRFLKGRFPEAQLQKAWAAWLERRFAGDFDRAREVLKLQAEESDWSRVTMAGDMAEADPRSYELSLMQQQLVTDSTNRCIRALRPVTPHHLQFCDVEGCEFSNGYLTSYIPEQMEADAVLHEYYHWEGTRSYQMMGGSMPEPVPNKPSAEIMGAVGYVQMLTRWLRCAGLPVVMTHGTDIGGKKRGVYTEAEQQQIIGRYNRAFIAAGGNGVCYWCWTDDELSKTYTRAALGMEFDADENAVGKIYQQSGETMGIIRYDGSYRPVCENVRELSRERAGKPAVQPENEICVLMPAPVFYSRYRYRANQTVFGIFNGLARAGLQADARFSSAGLTGGTDTKYLDLALLAPYKLIILGASAYRRDHPETADTLLRYVEAGGHLFFAPAQADSILDAHSNPVSSPALKRLTGSAGGGRSVCGALNRIRVSSARDHADAWSLSHDEPAFLFEPVLPAGAQVLAETDGGRPLLYRHFVGKGSVFVFCWSLDVFMFKDEVMDHGDAGMDWLWRLTAKALGLKTDTDNEAARILRAFAKR